MSIRTFVFLISGAFCSIILVLMTLAFQPSYRDAVPAGDWLFRDLIGRGNEVVLIKLKHAGNLSTFERKGGQWHLVESDGYVVQANKIAQIIFGISQLKLLEPKTKKKERLVKLHLESPEGRFSRSQRVTLYDKTGASMADIVVGRGNFSLPQTAGSGGVYVRLPNEDQAWLALGHLDLGVEPRDWLIRQILDIKEDRVKSISVVHPDGEIFEFKDSLNGLVLNNIPKGKVLIDKDTPRAYASVLDGFLINDARLAKNIQGSTKIATPVKVTYIMKDKLELRLNLWEQEKTKWLSVVAIGGESASQINARTAGWAYNIPDYHFDNLVRKKNQLLQDLEKKS